METFLEAERIGFGSWVVSLLDLLVPDSELKLDLVFTSTHVSLSNLLSAERPSGTLHSWASIMSRTFIGGNSADFFEHLRNIHEQVRMLTKDIDYQVMCWRIILMRWIIWLCSRVCISRPGNEIGNREREMDFPPGNGNSRYYIKSLI